ncbi:MAG: cytochrome c oxidase subunit II [Chloroflexi bacterium]|nr:cytochrome c oxidase subunit II [Chloroflexota bacterium]
MRKHWIAVIALTIVGAALLALLFLKVPLVPAQAAKQAAQIDTLLTVQLALGGAIFALVMVFLVYSVIAFRRRPGDTDDGPPTEGNAALETVWTIIPLALVLSLATYGGIVLRDMLRPPPGQELVVKVNAMQFAWLFEYPQYGFTSPQLRMPVDQPVLLRLASRDVIHSFWVPEFRVKMDAVPGMEKHLRITPTVIGNYQVQCAELCGLLHWAMRAPVSVVDGAAFQQWIAEQRK